MDEMTIVPKGWGYEKWIVNKQEYCGKILFFHKKKKCSLHYHKLKDEVFYIQSGKIIVLWTDDLEQVENVVEQQRDGSSFLTTSEPYNRHPAAFGLKVQLLEKGDKFHVPQGRLHQMYALEDTELFEFSTQHFESDSYRIAKGD